MPIEYDENGITIQNLTEILDERENSLQSDELFGTDYIITGDSAVGNLQYADADRELALQELALYLASQMNVDTAEGVFLDYIAFRSFITRQPASYTTIPVTITGTANLTVEAFKLVIKDNSTDRLYTNRSSFTIGLSGTVDIIMSCTDLGPVTANSGSTYTVSTPVLGVTTALYKVGGETVVGSNVETDAEFRARRELSLDLLATSTKSSIKSAVSEVSGVTNVYVIENDTNATVDTVPAKAFEVVVMGGDNTEVAQAILSKKPAGIQAYGVITVDVEDEDGDTFNIGFTRPSEVALEMRITIDVESTQPTEWLNTVKQELVNKLNTLNNPNQNIYAFNYYSVLDDKTEVINVSQLQIQKEIDSNLWSDIVIIGKREFAILDVANIAITQNLV